MKTVIIGSGNLATHLSIALQGAGMPPCQVYSPTPRHAATLAARLGCLYTDNLDEVITDADTYIISTKDDAIRPIASRLAEGRAEATLIHTAGSVAIDVLSDVTPHAAVLYPMQTFSKGRELCFNDIPCFIEATDEVSQSIVSQLAHAVSDKVISCDSAKRRQLHLAAVFSCNLTNHCYRLAEKILQQEGLDFTLFQPLIMETARKACTMSPRDAQTGPMVRHDVEVMQRQLDLITDPLTKEIYQLMAQSIYLDSQ